MPTMVARSSHADDELGIAKGSSELRAYVEPMATAKFGGPIGGSMFAAQAEWLATRLIAAMGAL